MQHLIGHDIIASLIEFCGGAVTICDRRGIVIETIPPEAGNQDMHEHFISSIIADTIKSRQLINVITKNSISLVTINLGENIIMLDNRNRVEDKLKFRQIIEDALPFIAQVAGGTAVLFDRLGTRFQAIRPDGKHDKEAEGKSTFLSQCVMQELRPSIGPSSLSAASTAVRIPLTAEYGVAFNNAYSTKQRQRLLDSVRQNRYANYHIEDIIGESPLMSKAKKLAREVAKSKSTVLITGETGTGKELFAQAIHNLSPRYMQPFVAINCAALPSELVESILFGYAEGAFTGARKSGQIGAFEQANGGTLFLDEISALPLHLQAKLLRVLQEREVNRVGDSKAIKVDVRIIASSNEVLPELIKAGKFRADLYFRLNVFEIAIPPLRERTGDLIALTDFMLKKLSSMLGKNVEEITPAAMQELSQYSWPGNVRELQNCLEYALNIVDINSQSITTEFLPSRIRKLTSANKQELSLYEEHMCQAEKNLVVQALAVCSGNKAEAARRLGINRTKLWRIIKKHNVDDAIVTKSNGVAKMNT